MGDHRRSPVLLRGSWQEAYGVRFLVVATIVLAVFLIQVADGGLAHHRRPPRKFRLETASFRPVEEPLVLLDDVSGISGEGRPVAMAGW